MTKMKKLAVLFLAALMALSFSACQKHETPTEKPTEAPTTPATPETTTAAPETDAPTEPVPAEVTITDMIGRELTVIPGSYKRVVCIGAGALRMYSYIGDVALLSGVEDIDNTSLSERPKMFDTVARPYVLAYGETFQTLPSCGVGGPQAQAAEAEKILSCDPDIVISEYEDVDKENALQEQLGVPVVTLRSGPQGVFGEEFKGSMRLLGQIFDRAEKAEALVSYVEKEAEEITKRTAAVKDEDKPSVYICGLGNWGTTNHLMTAQNYISFKVANIKNAVKDLANPGIQAIEEEKFVAIGEDIDIMIMDAAAVKNIKPLYQADKTMFDTVKAWRDGEVYLEMAYNAYYTNYEIALANTWFIAKTVYPSLFEDIDMTAKTNEITQAFYGMDLADAIFAFPQSFGGYQKIDTATFFE
ncbi:MAG: ABC transporter substrate-binding protein [Lachnospiraceae bacterium]|nr:ABC transporter substrate-binding protein [Lachnospiraceae bacterium]